MATTPASVPRGNTLKTNQPSSALVSTALLLFMAEQGQAHICGDVMELNCSICLGPFLNEC